MSNNTTNPTMNIDPSTAAAAADIARNDEPKGCLSQCCGCRYNPSVEKLEYDYAREAKYNAALKVNGGVSNEKEQPLPRIRQRGEYYIDSFNGESWSCSFGTNEEVSETCEKAMHYCLHFL